MMKKDICQVCKLSRSLGNGWQAPDEDFWVRGETCCPAVGWHFVSVRGEPPEGCWYRLEHVILGQTKDGCLRNDYRA